MWGASEESSGAMEGSPPEAVVHTKETCEQNKNQLESLKEIMIKNQESLKKKEEEVQVMYTFLFRVTRISYLFKSRFVILIFLNIHIKYICLVFRINSWNICIGVLVQKLPLFHIVPEIRNNTLICRLCI